MKMNEGVEWATHCCLNLSWAEPQRVTAAKLAAFYDLPTAYLNKQLQALARAGIVSSTSGPRGGFQLARSPQNISLLDVMVAIEGAELAFRCTDIRQHGPAGGMGTAADFRRPCAVSHAMRGAELTWRRELAAVTIADIAATVEGNNPTVRERIYGWFDTVRV
jgi:Rrf2 family protein